MKNTFFVFSLLSILFLGLSSDILAQKAKRPDSNNSTSEGRFFLEGSFGFNVNNNSTAILFSPLIGYKINNKLSSGGGPMFEYTSYRYNQTDVYKNTTFGGRAFARYNVLDNLFVHGEYNIINYKRYIDNKRIWESHLPVGGGYRQSLAGRSTINFMVLYDVLYNQDSDYNRYSTYNGFIIRGGINFGF
ncbi:MAG: hypothetical protein ACPG5B_13970 [Chitinophagales bacterium]